MSSQSDRPIFQLRPSLEYLINPDTEADDALSMRSATTNPPTSSQPSTHLPLIPSTTPTAKWKGKGKEIVDLGEELTSLGVEISPPTSPPLNEMASECQSPVRLVDPSSSETIASTSRATKSTVSSPYTYPLPSLSSPPETPSKTANRKVNFLTPPSIPRCGGTPAKFSIAGHTQPFPKKFDPLELEKLNNEEEHYRQRIREETRNTASPRNPGPIKPPPPVPDRINILHFKPDRHAHLIEQYPRPVEAGTTLLEVTAKYPTLYSVLVDRSCSGCLMNYEQLDELIGGYDYHEMDRCSLCDLAWFCNRECYLKGGEAHIEECGGVARGGNNVHSFHTITRLVAKIVRAQSTDEDERNVLPQWKLLTMMDHDEEIGIERITSELEEYFMYEGQKHDMVESTVRKVMSCLFTLYGPDGMPIGLCISPMISNIAHNCLPNANLIFPNGPTSNGGIKVVAIKSIKPGEEVLISYTHPTMPYHYRSPFLQRYGFQHSVSQCELCSDTKLDIRWAITHHGVNQQSDCKGCFNLMKKRTINNSEGGSSLEEVERYQSCSRCHQQYKSPDLANTTVGSYVAWMMPFAEMEQEGQLIGQNEMDSCSRLKGYYSFAAVQLCRTTFPLPLIAYRLARILLSHDPSEEKDLYLAGLGLLADLHRDWMALQGEAVTWESFWITMRLSRALVEMGETEKDESEDFVAGFRISTQACWCIKEANEWTRSLPTEALALGFDQTHRIYKKARAVLDEAQLLQSWASKHGYNEYLSAMDNATET